LTERIRGRDTGRQDDVKDDVIRHRFDVYREQTAPLLEHYGRKKATKVDATKSPLRVLYEIVQSLVPREISHSEQAAAVTARLAYHSENLITPTPKEREL
jgi:adenylate kinase